MDDTINNLCRMNCTHRDACNESIRKALESVKEKIVWVQTCCGRMFKAEVEVEVSSEKMVEAADGQSVN